MMMGGDDEEMGAMPTPQAAAAFTTPPSKKKQQSTGSSQTDDFASPYSHYMLSSSALSRTGGSGKLASPFRGRSDNLSPTAAHSTGFGGSLSDRLSRSGSSPWRRKASGADDEHHPLDYAAHSEKRAAAAARASKKDDLDMASIYRSKSRSPDNFSRENML
jgi:hypothetical protein